MAKNYLFTHKILDERKGEICAFHELTSSHINHQTYIHKFIRPAVKAANCGWSDVKYHCVKYPGSDHLYPYMVLYIGNKPERWIPVDGNSDGCNLQVIGENIW